MVDDTDNGRSELWNFLGYFLGSWEGSGRGQPGIGRSQRTYCHILSGRFIEVFNRSTYEPQEQNPQGEIHEDLGLFSYDKSRELVVLREFHVEGYVNQYIASDWDREGGTLTFETEAVENIPSGWQARTTYNIVSENSFIETFDLAGPGQAWTCYITHEFERQIDDQR